MEGCLIIVSHDRYFLDKLVDHLFIFEGEGKIRDFWGTYSEYKERIEEDKKEQPQLLEPIVPDTPNAQNPKNDASSKKKMSFKDKFELEQLDNEIPALETEKKSLENKLQSGELSYEDIQSVSMRVSEIVTTLEEKELRWLELDELRS